MKGDVSHTYGNTLQRSTSSLLYMFLGSVAAWKPFKHNTPNFPDIQPKPFILSLLLLLALFAHVASFFSTHSLSSVILFYEAPKANLVKRELSLEDERDRTWTGQKKWSECAECGRKAGKSPWWLHLVGATSYLRAALWVLYLSGQHSTWLKASPNMWVLSSELRRTFTWLWRRTVFECRDSKRRFQGEEIKGLYSDGFTSMWWDVKKAGGDSTGGSQRAKVENLLAFKGEIAWGELWKPWRGLCGREPGLVQEVESDVLEMIL